VLAACDNKEPIVNPRGEEYFPLEVGRISEFRVDSVIFDDAGAGNKLDTFSSFLREIVVAKFAGQDGDTVYRIQREHRRTADLPWQISDIYTMQSDGYEAIRSEENIRLVKMTFPLYVGKGWEPAKYVSTSITVPVGTETINMYSYWDGQLLALDVPEQVGTFAFDSVMTCLQADDDNELERRYVLEKYAKDIGLVFRKDTIVDSRCERLGTFDPCLGQTWMEKGEKGYLLEMELISHN
jgi:hypothetical protein